MRPPRTLEHPLLHFAVGRRAPRSDQSLPQGEVGIGDHLFQIELDRAPEAFAFRAGANRAVGGKKSRRGLRIGGGAARTIEAAVEVERLGGSSSAIFRRELQYSRASAAEIEGLVDRLADTFFGALERYRDAI